MKCIPLICYHDSVMFVVYLTYFDTILLFCRMQKKSGNLNDMFKLYLFTRALPSLLVVIQDLLDSIKKSSPPNNNNDDMFCSQNETDDEVVFNELSAMSEDKKEAAAITLTSRFITPLSNLTNKFSLFQQLVEHVIDMNQLPDVVINPKHDPDLQELRDEQKDLESQAEKLAVEARR